MTDKQIMIDGVDVNGCKYYNPNIKMDCILYPLQPDACKNNPNCYYKQLARKEQECKELKEINSTLLEYRRHAVTCQECYEDGLEDGKTSNKELRKLKQTLAEIKEIAEKVYNDCDNCYRDVDTNYDVDCIDCTLGGKAKLAEQILQKISEVIPSEN